MHCPATLLLAPTPEGEGGVRALVDELADEMVLAVVTAPGSLRGSEVADVLGAPQEEEPDLAAGEPSPSVLGGIADLHRGETVLVLTCGAPAGRPTTVTRIELGEAF